MKINSIKFKICVLYVIVLGSILAAYRGVLYFNMRHTLYNSSNASLRGKAVALERAVNAYYKGIGQERSSFIIAARKAARFEKFNGEGKDLSLVKDAEGEWLEAAAELNLANDYIQILSSKGKPLAVSTNLDRELRLLLTKDLRFSVGESFSNLYFKKYNLSLRVIHVPFLNPVFGKYIIQIATSSAPIVSALRARFTNTAFSIPIIMLFAAFIGWVLVERILNPVLEITRAAKNISHKNLSCRVKADKADAEIKFLADAFNGMIARLQESFNYIDEFNSHVAHELKTPLAIIKGESELALRKERDIEDYKRALKVNLEEADKMQKLINDLLLFARLSYNTDSIAFEKFCFADLMKEIYEQSKILASQKSIALNIDMREDCSLEFQGSKLHLRRLFLNLLDNAIKFTPIQGSINIRVSRGKKKLAVSVADSGPGIPEKDLPHIFRKFFSGSNNGQSEANGSGLGLSIAQSIARIHSGEISVKSQPQKGSIFTVALPVF